jgi:hypothetical protein
MHRKQASTPRAQREESPEHEARLRRELDEVKQSALLANQVKALREADLEELQAKYRATLSIQLRQQQLLVKLGDLLALAASYIHQIVEDQPAVASTAQEGRQSIGGQLNNRASKSKSKAKRAAKSSRRSRPERTPVGTA